jgi:hypothetical protein
MSKTRRDQERGRGLGEPHPTVPHLYRKVPQTPAEAMYPHLPSDQQVRDRERLRERDRRAKNEK